MWKLPLICLLLTTIIIVVGFVQLGSIYLILFFVAIGIAFSIGIVRAFRAGKKLNLLLQEESPEPFINFYQNFIKRSRSSLVKKIVRKSDYTEYLLVANSCITYIIYGHFEQAKRELYSIDWESKPPIIHSQKLLLESLLMYLEKHDYEEGIKLALEAREKASLSPVFPGSSTSLLACNSYIWIGEALNGTATTDTINNLKAAFKKLPILSKLLIAFGLQKYYFLKRDRENAEEMAAFIRTNAPYCKSLQPDY